MRKGEEIGRGRSGRKMRTETEKRGEEEEGYRRKQRGGGGEESRSKWHLQFEGLRNVSAARGYSIKLTVSCCSFCSLELHSFRVQSKEEVTKRWERSTYISREGGEGWNRDGTEWMEQRV